MEGIVALAWGYTPSLTTQMMAFRELEEDYRGGSATWPNDRFQGGQHQSIVLALKQASVDHHPG